MKRYQIPLTIFERISIPDILPKTAKYEVGIVVRDLREKISLTQDEIVQLEVKTQDVKDGGQFVQWNETKAKSKPFDLTQLEFELIKGNLVSLNEKGELSTDPRWLALFEKITTAKPTK